MRLNCIHIVLQVENIERVFSCLTQLVQLHVFINYLQTTVNHLNAFAKAYPQLKKMHIETNQLHNSLTPKNLNEFLENHKNIERFVLNIYVNIPNLQQTFCKEDFPNFTLNIKRIPFGGPNSNSGETTLIISI